MQTFSHKCLKCDAKYSDTDPDPYYCDSCKIEVKRIAAEVDAKVKPSKKKMGSMELYDSLPKVRGFVNAKDIL